MVFFLVGCEGEIEKCLDVEMAGWEARQERVARKNTEILNEKKRLLSLQPNDKNNKVEYFPNLISNQIDALEEIKKDERSKDEVIADLRSTCMRAVNKK